MTRRPPSILPRGRVKRAKLTPKQKVLAVYPNAQALHPNKRYCWIHRNAWPAVSILDGRMLGDGRNAASAWADAARRLRPARTPLACLDCGKPYRDFPLDSTLPNEQWRMIHASAGGLLCAGCMVARAAKLPGAVAVRMQIEFA